MNPPNTWFWALPHPRTGPGQALSEATGHQMGQEQGLNPPGSCWAGAIPAEGVLQRGGVVDGAEAKPPAWLRERQETALGGSEARRTRKIAV